MTVRDFLRKGVTVARNQGVSAAVKQGAVEATHAAYVKANSRRGDSIWAHDWDICVVIDACRADAFADVTQDIDWIGAGPTLWSLGSASPEWYGKTFAPGQDVDLSRVGVVTANPFSAKPAERAAGAPPGSLPLSARGLGYLDEVWRDSWGHNTGEGHLDVTSPGVMAQRAAYAWAESNVEQLVVHFMQPHIPFRSRPEWFGSHENLQHFGEPSKEGGKDPWHKVRDGELPRDKFLAAYRDNLRWVLPWVRRLYQHTGARTLVTSDHGNAAGEWGMWSHPPKVHIRALRRVPAVTLLPTGPTRVLEPAAPPKQSDGSNAEGKLAALGYR